MHLSARPPAPAAPLEQASGLSAGIPLTVAMALAEVARWDDLTPTRRRDLASALRGVCRLADLPPAAVELSPVFLRERVFDRTATHHGVKRPTMCTLRSALRYVLRRLGLMDPADAPLSPAWRAALAGLPAYRPYGLIAFARFCSVRGVAPEAVDDAALADFEAWLTERNLTPKPRKTAGDVRGGWNRACREVADWPGRPLGRLARPKAYVLPPEAFPASFRADLEAFRRRLGSNVLDLPEPGSAEEENRLLDMRPLRPSTVAMRVDHARWAASALVASGAVPMEQITSLRDLVSPFGRIEAAIGFLYRRAEAAEGERERRPSAAGHHVAEVLRIIAKHHGALSPRQLERLQGWRDRVALKYDGMTLRNERTMQAILQPDKLTALLELPGVLMGAARRLRDEAPPQARSLAMRALAIAILTHLPLRLANLAGLDLDRNLYRPDPRRGAITELWIPPGETKGRKEIRMPIPAGLSALIREWIADYRPAIPGCRWLFPGYGRPGERIGHQGLRDAIKGAIATHVGVNMTPHQFRHLAATLFLEAFPDHYEELRQLLGHSSFEITRRYSGNVQGRAARRYQDLVMGRRSGGTPGGGQRDTRRGSRR
ncbi:hypothetical protein HVPorG_04725 (plasmid) [Roseomonas mucosa]|jgi:integrase|uniref:Tyr recombinase domain-containing protein n=1 Tax=Roseomonas mucosa TaxID=207340 RepID=A0A1S8D1Z5_9PROT|nr:site-specific integrase [Roseomonas mucosa]PZR07623.1 MAG: site-specific integrase [Azospirillum brasilense]ONH81784.1 hypothetical protein APZ41_018005 [Roseomonas mucosa]QDD97360.1 hypothetical protein ADP8_04725 [Roseomonas mucosa]QDJ12144.1 hypothetical protein HVPorG_04725 [Roseomonas mucosa]QET91408.1 site-specific integrase [Roseomonas mucosa]